MVEGDGTVIQKHVLTVCVDHRDETALLKNVQYNLLSVGYGTEYDETATQKNYNATHFLSVINL